jgi:hypothetical protein
MVRKLLNYISRGILSKNIKFKNKHKGEECYIFGNGSSIKYFELSKFSDKVSFGCNSLHLHKDILDLDMRYYLMMHPLVFSKYWRGVKSGLHIERNPFYFNVHEFAKHRKCNIFTHASNYLNTKKYSRFNYIHNYDKHKLSIENIDFTSSSSFARGAMVTMIGMAMYMGFKKIYLVGCDYWFDPISRGHFYSDTVNVEEGSDFLYDDLMKIISKKLELIVVTRNGIKSPVDYIEYTDLTGADERKQSAIDIVSSEDLAMLEKTLYLRK